MTWGFVAVLAATAYGFKVLGLVVLGGRALPDVVARCAALIPPALLAALIVKDTASIGQHLVLDARAAGVAVAVLASWRRLPLVVVIVAAAAVTALVRLGG